MGSLFIQLYKSLKKYPYEWFCGAVSHMRFWMHKIDHIELSCSIVQNKFKSTKISLNPARNSSESQKQKIR